ncbi:unnamed protein product [Parascedosporium putredinis]|uniref:Superoxide dismutase n=1 Tax=Parascedosporium putredinis TaxID=1442378 RepID=A0A9P1M8J5_9PEZI|nr:unnamed protein product [Parascedosporium putredinis]CAI7993664.1 unnamed protein product [Parascedosporium putredinis]
MSVEQYSLPSLPYAYDALEPSISAQIMELHHSKHHQAYITNLNAALQTYSAATSSSDVPARIALQAAIRFHGGGHINHSLFWENLTPAGSAEAQVSAAPALVAEIGKTWADGVEGFKKEFTAALLGIQGSGWGWLVKDGKGRLSVVTTKDQDPVYLNGKAAYVENIWKVINWQTCEKRFTGSREDVFAVLKASL